MNKPTTDASEIPAEPHRIKSMNPESLWLRIGNCEKPGRFQIILEATENCETVEQVIYNSIDECDGNISEHHNLTWLIKDAHPPKTDLNKAIENLEHAVSSSSRHSWTYLYEAAKEVVEMQYPKTESVRDDSFDEKAAREGCFADRDDVLDSKSIKFFIEGSRWQFERSQKQVEHLKNWLAAEREVGKDLKAEIRARNELVESLRKGTDDRIKRSKELEAELAKLHAEGLAVYGAKVMLLNKRIEELEAEIKSDKEIFEDAHRFYESVKAERDKFKAALVEIARFGSSEFSLEREVGAFVVARKALEGSK